MVGFLGVIWSIVSFPFKFLFGKIKKKEPATEGTSANSEPVSPTEISADNLKAKMDLMMSQVDSMKIENEAINQRIQNIERMVKELYVMAKS